MGGMHKSTHAVAHAALATVRAALEPAIFAEAFAAGEQMTVAEALAMILMSTTPR